jgi:hypothetical protein
VQSVFTTDSLPSRIPYQSNRRIGDLRQGSKYHEPSLLSDGSFAIRVARRRMLTWISGRAPIAGGTCRPSASTSSTSVASCVLRCSLRALSKPFLKAASPIPWRVGQANRNAKIERNPDHLGPIADMRRVSLPSPKLPSINCSVPPITSSRTDLRRAGAKNAGHRAGAGNGIRLPDFVAGS